MNVKSITLFIVILGMFFFAQSTAMAGLPGTVAEKAVETVKSSGEDSEKRPLAVIRRFAPDVLVRHLSGDAWKSAETAQSLFAADSLITGESGFAMVQFMDNSVVRLRPNSLLVLDGEVKGPDNVVSRLTLEAGEILTTVTGRNSTKEVSTSSTVAAVRGTEFTTRVDENGSTTIIGLSGEVTVRPLNSEQSYTILTGNRIDVQEDGMTVSESDVTPEELERIRQSFEPEEPDYREVEFRFINDEGEVETIILRFRKTGDE